MRLPTSSCTRREFLRLGGLGIGALALLPAMRALAGSAGKPSDPGLEAKIGQMILVGFRGYKLKDKNPFVDDLEEHKLGGAVLFDYDVASGKYRRNIQSPEQLAALDAALQAATPIPPLVISIDQEGGRINRPGASRSSRSPASSHAGSSSTTLREPPSVAATGSG